MPIQTDYSRHLSDASVDGAIAALSAMIADEGAVRRFDESAASTPRVAGKWSRKEILGHLCDSAGNNLQRIVRAQIPAHLTNGVLRGPGYAQDEWIRVNAWSALSWTQVIETWLAMNRHILHVIKKVDRGAMQTMIVVGENQPETLEYIIVDYVAHQLHHLKQITG
jgi:hypothetical protein